MLSVVVLLLTVGLTPSPPFGEAEASAVETTRTTMTLDVIVSLTSNADIVLAQPYDSDGTALPPTAMSSLGDGSWGAQVTVPRRGDIRFGFEILAGSDKERSSIHSAIDLGVDRAIFSDPVPEQVPETTEPLPVRGVRWGWLALAAGGGALLLLVLWAFAGPRTQRSEADEQTEHSAALDD